MMQSMKSRKLYRNVLFLPAFLLFVLAPLTIFAAPGDIHTIAGSGLGAGIGDGGPAAEALLWNPKSVAVDASGNVFIADYWPRRIRKVNAADGTISTVAGNGSPILASTGDGGPATSASIDSPASVFVDASGNLFIAEDYGNRIRKVSAADGTISTVAGNGNSYSPDPGDGGPATSAGLQSPSSVFVDSAGNIFIADKYNNRVRKVNASDGIITTVAGNGLEGNIGNGGPATSARLYRPNAVFVDLQGNIYIAEGNWVRKVNASDGIISTITGSTTAGYSGDGGPAASALLNAPHGLFVDQAGNIFIGDSGNTCIRKINATDGTSSTVAGHYTGLDVPDAFYYDDYLTTLFAGDNGPALSATLNYFYGFSMNAAGDIFIADSGNNRVRKVDASNGIIRTIAGIAHVSFAGDGGTATSAVLHSPTGVTIDRSGNIFIADAANDRIRKVNASDGTIGTVAGNDPRVYSSLGDGGPATAAVLNAPEHVFVDGSGNIFIADVYDIRIRKVNASDGTIITIAGDGYHPPCSSGEFDGWCPEPWEGRYAGDGGPATSASFSGLGGFFVDDRGNIFVADSGNARIRKINIVDGIITSVAGNGISAFAGDG